MAKRFEPMKEFGRSMKKPKLDMNICSGVDGNSQTCPTKASTVGKASFKSSINDFWDDDDDDVILLATQVVEAAVAAEKVDMQPKQNQYNNSMNITESEISFSEFCNSVPTSTQQQAPRKMPVADILSQMFQDDDDFELLAAVQISDKIEFKKPKVPSPTTLQTNKTQKPQLQITQQLQTSKFVSEDAVEFVLSQNTGPESTLPSSQSAARRQLASERQIKFLMEKVDVLKKENSKLNKDLTDAKSKMASKEGETTLLRDELRHLKQQAQTLKIEKFFSARNAQNECQSKMDELTKAVEAKEAEVRMKEMEVSLVKMRYENDAHRLQQSLCDESFRNLHIKNRRKEPSKMNEQHQTAKCLMRMPSLDVCSVLSTQFQECTLNQMHPSIYEHTLDRGSSKKQRTLFQIELENIQTKLAQLQLLGLKNLQKNFIKSCIESVCKVLPEFWSYIHSLEFPKNRRFYPYHDYSIMNTKCSRKRNDFFCSLQEPFELYDDERCLSLRRYLAALSIICKHVPELASFILVHKHGEYYILQIATDSVMKLGFAREICEHFGVLEALAVWLNSLLLHVSLETPHNILVMSVEFLKSLVFSRPSAWVFREISSVFRETCRLRNMLELMCVNSSKATFITDRVRSTYKFSNESCLLQVYCGLLEFAFPLSVCLPLNLFKLLVVLCGNHVRFAYQCLQKPPTFIQKLLPLYDDDEDDDRRNDTSKSTNNNNINNVFEITEQDSTTNLASKCNITSASTSHEGTSDASVSRCECYIKLCLSVVTLIFQLIRQWLLHKKQHYTLQVAEISQLSVQLLHAIFCENYVTCLFQDCEETTKHHLCLIVEWWSENSKQLKFNDINMKFLQKLKSSHVLPKNISNKNYSNLSIDMAEWQKITNENVKHLKYPKDDSEEDDSYESKLHLIQDASNHSKFFEGLKGFAFNFQ